MALAEFTRNEKAARDFIGVGNTRPDPALSPAELAAWTLLANVILNLDEMVTKG